MPYSKQGVFEETPASDREISVNRSQMIEKTRNSFACSPDRSIKEMQTDFDEDGSDLKDEVLNAIKRHQTTDDQQIIPSMEALPGQILKLKPMKRSNTRTDSQEPERLLPPLSNSVKKSRQHRFNTIGSTKERFSSNLSHNISTDSIDLMKVHRIDRSPTE